MVLLPCGCDEYRASAGFTKLQSKKIGVKDLIEGCSYKTKREEILIYLGKLNWYECKQKLKGWRNSHNRISHIEKIHVFLDKNNALLPTSKLDHLAERTTDTAVSNYAELMDVYTKSKYSFKPISLEETVVEVQFKGTDTTTNDSNYQQYGPFFRKKDNGVYTEIIFRVRWDYNRLLGFPNYNSKPVFKGYEVLQNNIVNFKDRVLSFDNEQVTNKENIISKEKVQEMKFVSLKVVLENGNKINIKEY